MSDKFRSKFPLDHRMKYIVRDIREQFDRNEAPHYHPAFIKSAKRKYVKWRLENYGVQEEGL